jgi:hypothetical protein
VSHSYQFVLQWYFTFLGSEVGLVVDNREGCIGNGIDHEFLLIELKMKKGALCRIVFYQIAFDKVFIVCLYQLYLPLFYVLYLPVGYLSFHSRRTQTVPILNSFENCQMNHLLCWRGKLS